MKLSKHLFCNLALVAAITAKTIDIKVGDGGDVFEPNTITAAKGDDIVFHYFRGHHDVAQGRFDKPCNPLDGGFYSGFIYVDGSEPNVTFTVKINNTDPMWIYCSSPHHCQNGMAAVINPPKSGDTLEAYLKAAKNADSVTPKAVTGGVRSDASNSTQTASGTVSGTASSTATASATQATHSKNAANILVTKDSVLRGIAAVFAGWLMLV